MNTGWRTLLAATAVLTACSPKTEASSGKTPDPAAHAGTGVPSEAWKALLPKGAKVEEHLTADLDGDGMSEIVVL